MKSEILKKAFPGLFKYYLISEETNTSKADDGKLLELFQLFGQAKHEPCGEQWDVSYGESAWRLAIMALCLPRDVDRVRIVKVALTSSFTR